MNIGLFAADVVGTEIAKFFGDTCEPLTCLVIDQADRQRLNEQIVGNITGCECNLILTSDSLYTEKTLAQLRSLGLDLIILAWWPYILKREILLLPRLGCLNFHPSYLPYNRGKHYNFWTLVEDSPFGVTIHWVNEGIDTGDIAFQSVISKSWEDTGETLYYKAQKEMVSLFRQKYPEIKRGDIPRRPQDPKAASFHYAHEIEKASMIDLDRNYSARFLLNLLRARTFPPHPAAFFVESGATYEVRIQISSVKEKGSCG